MNNVEFVKEDAFCPVTLGGLAVILKSGEDEIVCMGFLDNEPAMFNFYPNGDKIHFRKDYEIESEDPELFEKCKQIISFAEEKFKLKEKAEKYYSHYKYLYDKEMELLETHMSDLQNIELIEKDPNKIFSNFLEINGTLEVELSKIKKEFELIKKCIIPE